MNVDENPVTPSSYRVTGIPTLNLYQGGEVVKSIVGARPKAALLNELADVPRLRRSETPDAGPDRGVPSGARRGFGVGRTDAHQPLQRRLDLALPADAVRRSIRIRGVTGWSRWVRKPTRLRKSAGTVHRPAAGPTPPVAERLHGPHVALHEVAGHRPHQHPADPTAPRGRVDVRRRQQHRVG